MPSIEDILRASLHDKANELPANAVPPPLRLPARPSGPLGSRNRRGGAGWPRWLAAPAAVALVAAAVAGSVLVSRSVPGGGQISAAAASAAARAAGVPGVYVALTGYRDDGSPFVNATGAVVKATATGEVLARIAPSAPYGTFIGVTSAPASGTFVLAAEPPRAVLNKNKHRELESHASGKRRDRIFARGEYPPTRFFILNLSPAGARGGVARPLLLPSIKAPADTELIDLALSPDGKSLAAAYGSQLPAAKTGLYVYNLATGSHRTWSQIVSRHFTGHHTFVRELGIGGGFAGVNVGSLSWAADGRTLAIMGDDGVRLLDTRLPGSSLKANSRLVVPGPRAPVTPYWRNAIITPDGRSIIADIELVKNAPDGTTLSVRQRLVRFSVATGRVTSVINDMAIIHGAYEQVLWTSPDGQSLIVTGVRAGPTAGLITRGHDTALPWQAGILSAAW